MGGHQKKGEDKYIIACDVIDTMCIHGVKKKQEAC